MGVRSYPKAHVEWRIVCADPTHRQHAYGKPNRAKAEQSIVKANSDPIYTNPTPYQSTCLPWTVEHRQIGEWRDEA